MTGQTVSIRVNGQNVLGHRYLPKKEPKNVGVLFLHGWTGMPNEYAAEMLAGQGYHALTIQMRGHGMSDGDIKKVTAKDSLEDAINAYDLLTNLLPAKGPIVAVGNSYGSYISILLSREKQLAGLSLRVPAAYPDEVYNLPKWGRGHDDPIINSWRLQSHGFDTNEAFNLLHNFSGKIQILEAENDEIIPHQTVENYKNAVSNSDQLSYKVLKGWPHSMGEDPVRNNEFQTILLEWLNEL